MFEIIRNASNVPGIHVAAHYVSYLVFRTIPSMNQYCLYLNVKALSLFPFHLMAMVRDGLATWI